MKLKQVVAFVFFLLLFPSLVFSQSEVRDDATIIKLKKELASHKSEDTSKVKLLNDLGYYLLKTDPSESKKSLKKALTLSKKIEYKNGEADAYKILGIVEKHQGNFDQAIEYYLNSLRIYSKMNSTFGVHMEAVVERNIGLCYIDQGNLEKANEFLNQSKKKFKSQSDSVWLMQVNNSLFNCHLKMADTLTARKYLEEAKSLAIEMKNEYWQTVTSLNMIVCQDPKHESNDIISTYEKALVFFESIGSKRDVAITNFNLGYHYATFTENTSLAITHLNLSIQQSEEIDLKLQFSKAHKVLYQLYEDQNKYDKAFYHLNMVDSIDRIIFSESSAKNLAETEVKYQTEKKNNEIALKQSQIELLHLEKKQSERVIYGLSIGILLFVVIIVLIVLQYRQKRRSIEKESLLQHKNHINEIEILKRTINTRLDQPELNDPINFELSKINSFITDQLSEREFEVLVELKKGKTNQEIADSLGLSINTIKTYLASLYVKMDAKNRIQAVQKANSILSVVPTTVK